MEIGKVLELTKEKRLADVARESLDIGEKRANQALKNAGCTFTPGRRGWFLADGADREVLKKSLYDYVDGKKPNVNIISKSDRAGEVYSPSKDLLNKNDRKRKSNNKSQGESRSNNLNASTNESKNNSVEQSPYNSTLESSNKNTNASKKEVENKSSEDGSNKSVIELDGIDRILSNPDEDKRVYRGFYWDKDVIDFIDNVKNGNKSDLLNEIVRAVMKAKKLV